MTPPTTVHRNPLRLFICYAHEDKTAIRSLYQQLDAAGTCPWLDEEDILPGQDWQLEIRKIVQATNIILVCLSHTSTNQAGYINKEISFALDIADEQPEGTIFLIPVRLEDCSVPDRLNRWHWVDLFEKRGYKRLIRALRKRAEQIGATLPRMPDNSNVILPQSQTQHCPPHQATLPNTHPLPPQQWPDSATSSNILKEKLAQRKPQPLQPTPMQPFPIKLWTMAAGGTVVVLLLLLANLVNISAPSTTQTPVIPKPETPTSATLHILVPTAEQTFIEGRGYLDAGKYDLARESFDRLIVLNREIEPDEEFAMAYYYRGQAYLGLGQYEQADQDFAYASSINTKNAPTYYNRGIIALYTKDYPQAIEFFTQALTIEPAYAKALNDRGIAYMESKNLDRAIEDFTSAIELNPDFDIAYCNRGIAYSRNGEPDKAIADFEQAQALSGEADWCHEPHVGEQ